LARVRAESIGAVLLRVHGDIGRHRRGRRLRAGDVRRRPRRLRGSGHVEEPERKWTRTRRWWTTTTAAASSPSHEGPSWCTAA